MRPPWHTHVWMMDAFIADFREQVRRCIAIELATRLDGWRHQGYRPGRSGTALGAGAFCCPGSTA